MAITLWLRRLLIESLPDKIIELVDTVRQIIWAMRTSRCLTLCRPLRVSIWMSGLCVWQTDSCRGQNPSASSPRVVDRVYRVRYLEHFGFHLHPELSLPAMLFLTRILCIGTSIPKIHQIVRRPKPLSSGDSALWWRRLPVVPPGKKYNLPMGASRALVDKSAVFYCV